MEVVNLDTREKQNAFMNPARQDILRLLQLAGRPMTPKELADKMGISASSVTFHIKKLVELMMNHGIKKEDILAIFQKEAKDIRVGDMHNGEFDFWVRFPEENEDEYYYCFKDEGCHMIYHRFLPEDYADFGF